MNNLDKTYTNLLQDILDNGVKKETRNGGTISVFGRQIRHKMSEGFPLLTTKKIHWKSIVTELLWFLKGDTNIQYLVQNGCHIWDGDAYKNYENKYYKGEAFGYKKLNNLEYSPDLKLSQEEFIKQIKTDEKFAKKWGELGPIYGKQWRSWEGYHKSFDNETRYIKNVNGIDQIANSINLLKTDPDSRRNRVSSWNVGELDQMTLPPCHTDFQFYTRELSESELWEYIHKNKIEILHQHAVLYGHEVGSELRKSFVPTIKENYNIPTRAISLMWNQRSVDTFLGLPFNIASYGLLLEIIAKEVNMIPDELIGNLGDVHLYKNHIEQAKEQIGREMTTEERNEWHFINRCGGNKRDCKTDWKDFELDQQDVPKRTRESYPLPILNIFEPAIGKEISILDNLHIWSPNCFIIENYQSHPTIKAPLSN